ncbi:MAG TPA: biotin carboxylase N-terminal domain-containing protein [Sunxiuqinia sp.]|nr:biotin carboxylase N-terminal domain-containing protein [Sunxiuqinia sp.]
MALFHKILIANRGEIAVRVLKTAQKLGIKTVSVYAADDEQSLHVCMADEAIQLEGNTLQETYLNQEKLIELALQYEADAIHPGYGFLSENAAFAEKVEQAGLIFIGATPEQIRLMGEKIQAINFVKELGLPVIPSATGAVSDILNHRNKLEFPLLVKASGGGGGKGMEVVHELAHLPLALQQAQRQAQQYFGNGELFVEKYLAHARHIEVQLLGDGKGNVVHLFERECSIQRRYQKLVEEAPASSINQGLKDKLYQTALKIAEAIQYRGAGTIEFLVDQEFNFYFLEMNTRLQVEHPVTESITGLDLVEWQIRMAAGENFVLEQDAISANGHAIELRICAEDPQADFKPTSGLVKDIHASEESRWDSFLSDGALLSPNYDSMVGKLVVHGKDRSHTVEKMQKAVEHLHVSGLKTNQEFLHQLISHADFVSNSIHTKWVEDHLEEIMEMIKHEKQELKVAELMAAYLLHHFFRPSNQHSIWNKLGFWRQQKSFHIQINKHFYDVEVFVQLQAIGMVLHGKCYELNNYQFNGSKIEFEINNQDIATFISEEEKATHVQLKSKNYALRSNHVLSQVTLNKAESDDAMGSTNKVVADLFGKVVEVLVKPGDVLQKGQNLLVIESMKSEFTIQSPVDAVVKNIHVTKGKIVQDKELLVDFES